MTLFWKRRLKQKAMHWVAGAKDGFGVVTFAEPAEIDVRWEDQQVRFINAEGNEDVSEAVVYTNASIAQGDYLFLGDEDDLDSAQDALSQDGAYRVERVQDLPNFNNTGSLKRTWLK
jgi:hypothetical protein